jgi:hypothetical protein
MDINQEPFPTERVERLRERLRHGVIRQRTQVSVLTNDLQALFRWLDIGVGPCRYPMSYGRACEAYPNCVCGRPQT